LSLWLALLLGGWGASLSVAGAVMRRADLSASGERGVHMSTLFATLAAVGLGWALAVGDLTYRYVASWASYSTPLPYRIGAVWAGPSGGLLVGVIALGAGATLAALTMPRASALRRWTTAVLAIYLLAVVAQLCFTANPFLRLPFPPNDGRGVPLEWMRPVALLQMPVGFLAAAWLTVPAVITVMGVLGTGPWRTTAHRWAVICWALLATAMLLDWRRHYGDAAWADDWRWAPVYAGTAFAWAGATLLVWITAVPRRPEVVGAAGFAAFTLGLVGLTQRRSMGWDGVHAFAASGAGAAAAWCALGAVAMVAAYSIYAWRADRRPALRALAVAQGSALLVAVALAAAGGSPGTDVSVREGERARVTDQSGTPWTLSLEGISTVGREEIVINVLAVRAAVEGRSRGFVAPEVRSLFRSNASQAVDQVLLSGIASGLTKDLRVDVRESNTADAVLTVRFVPFAAWIWVGGVIAVVAAAVSALGPQPPEDGDAPVAGTDETSEASV
jgi:cytochrome c biogenesis factor